jgi:ABC-type glycerol-3-phosphate transport system substrate-binding protein
MGYGGVSPWPNEAKEGNIWPIYFQLGEAFFQSVIPTIDTNHNGDLDVTEASKAVISGKVSVKTPELRALWEEEYKLAKLWTPGWSSTDLDLLWRQGKLGIQYQGNWQIRNLMSDPTLAFSRVAAPAPLITHADDPLASDPIGVTKANGKVDPGSIILDPLQGTTHLCIMKSSTTAHHNFAAALKYVQFLGTPTNLAYLVNEYGDGIPPVPNVALNPIWQQFTHYSFPKYKYTISGWQVVFPNTPATDQEGRRSFVSWVTGQISESTFFNQLEKELIESAKAMLK